MLTKIKIIDGVKYRSVSVITTEIFINNLKDRMKQNPYSEGFYSLQDFDFGLTMSRKRQMLSEHD